MSQPAPLPIRMAGVGHEFGANGVRVRALDGIDLEVAPGELLAVMGPSGSGKSTLLSIAGGLERPTHGSVYVNGVDLATLDSVHRAEVRRRSIGYVFQDYNLIPSLSALENVEMPLQLDGVSPSKVREAAMAALEEVGVAELADRFPERLSGGQRQRVAIARGLVGNRSVILADEPTGALDSHTGEQIMLVLRDHIDAGAAGILVTHEARMAAWADRTVFLRDGRIVDRSRGDSLRDLQLDGVSPSKVREAAMAALEEVGVAELADRFPERLSGGQRQRVAIARGLVGNRSVILADEPTGALDSHTGEQIMLVLRDHIDAGAAGILVTHEARMAAWADRTVFLRDGRIVDRSRGDSLRDLLADTAPGI